MEDRIRRFREILGLNNRILKKITEINEKLSGDYVFDQTYVHAAARDITSEVERLVYALERLAPGKYRSLVSALARIQAGIEQELSGQNTLVSTTFVVPYDNLTRDAVDEVGAINAHLAEIGKGLGLNVPRSYAVTASAYHAFVETNALAPVIERISRQRRENNTSLAEASAEIRKNILNGRLPTKLQRDLTKAVEALTADGAAGVAVRSSAWLEDRQHSFAGQYKTILNVTPATAAAAYREVVASLFTKNAMAYRDSFGYRDHEIAMPVVCQEVIDAEISGVLYTRDFQAPGGDTMLVTAAWGLGEPIVSGTAAGDRFKISRHAPRTIVGMNVVRKPSALRPDPGGGTRMEDVEAERQTRMCLSREQLLLLAEAGMRIESHFRRPQDIEFAFDRRGNLIILQTRPLAIQTDSLPSAGELSTLLRDKPVLFRSKGQIAQRGIAAGPVWLVRTEDDLTNVPEGVILAARVASPLFAKVLDRTAAVITDVGSVTGHLATVAREFRIPTILNCGDAIAHLRHGQEITVDAEDNVVYDGLVPELRDYGMAEDPIEDTYEYRLLRRVLKRIEPLRLIDPLHEDFTAESCRSLHDITRFVHEKAVQELIEEDTYRTATAARDARRLRWHIPLDLLFVDAGGGLQPGAGKDIVPGDISSGPMQALLKGLSVPGAWSGEPLSVDFASFMSSLTRTMAPELAKPRHLGQNLALVSRDYVNMSLRLGYHFTMVDAYAVDNINDNYIYFRFFGGVTDAARRSRRAQFLGRALSMNNFRVEVRGDLVVGRIKRIDREEVFFRLKLLGMLIGFTRQLDVRMVDDTAVTTFIDRFKKFVEEADEYTDKFIDLG